MGHEGEEPLVLRHKSLQHLARAYLNTKRNDPEHVAREPPYLDKNVPIAYRGPMGRWHTTSRRIVYQNPWITVREDSVVFPNGKEGMYGIVGTVAE